MSSLKRYVAMALAALLIFAAVGCTKDTGTQNGTDSSSDPLSETDAPVTTDNVTDAPVTTENVTDAPETTAEPQPGPATPPKSLKVLAIGNSFSTDAMQYLAQISKNLGVEEVVLGNLYIGGCSLDTHYSHARAGDGAYTYYKTTNGTWTNTKNTTMLKGIKDEEWDIITLQQTSKTCGLPASYSNLAALVAYVEANKPASARIVWHMTWAYQQDSTHSSFPNYNKDQMTMYNMIISTTAQCVDTISSISSVIPVGTAIQNARTGFLGDTLTRDGYHLSYNIGRMLAGMTWFASLTGCSVEELTFNPSPAEITADVMALLKESVASAIANPRAVTESSMKTGDSGHTGTTPSDVTLEPEDFFEADKILAAASNVDLSGYTLFNWERVDNAYWYCTKGSSLVYPSASASTYNRHVCTAELYSRTQIPVGSVIICDPGWQYRPEKWLESKAAASSRPGMVSSGVVVIDEAWWGSNAWCAFNVSSSPKTDISANFANAAAHLRIYVPKS